MSLLSLDEDMQVAGEGSRFTFPGSRFAQYTHHWFNIRTNSHFCDNMPPSSLPNPFEDFPPPAIPYLPSFEEATSVGGGSLRLPSYRASYIRRYHPYIRWTRAPPRIVYYTVNPRLTIAELVQNQQREDVARAAAPLGIDILRALQSQLQILAQDASYGSGEPEAHIEDRK